MFRNSLNNLIDKLKDEFKHNEITDLRPIYDAFAFDVISKSAFGLNTNIMDNPDNPIFMAAKSFFHTGLTFETFICFLFPQLKNYFNLYLFNKQSQQTIADYIKQVIKARIDNNFEAKDLLQLSINASVFSPKVTSNSFESTADIHVIMF